MEEERAEDLVQRMQEDERESIYDLVDESHSQGGMGFYGLELMTPKEYALANDMVPQQVYYYIRRGVVKAVECLCGRTVIERNQADAALAERRKKRQGGKD